MLLLYADKNVLARFEKREYFGRIDNCQSMFLERQTKWGQLVGLQVCFPSLSILPTLMLNSG